MAQSRAGQPPRTGHNGAHFGGSETAASTRELAVAIVEACSAPILACDLDYNILALNAAQAEDFERLYGVRPRSGDNLLALLGDRAEAHEIRDLWDRALAGQAGEIVTTLGDAERGPGIYELQVRPLTSPSGQRLGACQFSTEISERLRLAAESAAIGDALRQSRKVEAIGQLTGGVAHDFNNLLTVLRGSIDILQKPGLSPERRRRYLDAASDTVDRATRLTAQLLAFARRQDDTPELFDVTASLRGAMGMFQSVVGARIRITVDAPEDACFVLADVSQFETAVINLLANARDAMSGGGDLTLLVGSGRGIPPIRNHAPTPEQFVSVTVADTGQGIAANLLPRIFEPFFTTKAVGKGTGLGLSQVIGFAKQSGGDIDVSSAPGAGTIFVLYLPQVEGHARPAPAAVSVVEEVAAVTAPILVVADNAEAGQFTLELLQDLGFEGAWAPSGEAALERLAVAEPKIGAVLSDLMMPGMGGLAFARELKRRYPETPVILTSGHTQALAASQGSGFELLQKPYTANTLTRALRAVLTRRSRDPATTARHLPSVSARRDEPGPTPEGPR